MALETVHKRLAEKNILGTKPSFSVGCDIDPAFLLDYKFLVYGEYAKLLCSLEQALAKAP